MKQLFFAALFAIGLTGAPAAAVVVRTGDHETFTRVVVALPPDVTWEVRRNGDVIAVDLPDLRSELDISSVFERIGRDRISDISVDTATLRVSLSCRCWVESFVTEPRLLVIDVLDGDANATRANESLVRTFPPEPLVARSASLAGADESASFEDRGLEDTAMRAGPLAARSATGTVVAKSPEVFSGRAFLEDYGDAVRRDQANNVNLADGLGAALKQSLAQAGYDGILDVEDDIDVQVGASTAWQIRPVLGDPTDVPRPKDKQVTQEKDVRLNCVTDNEIDLTTWTNSDDFLTELAAAQDKLFEPDGRRDPEAAVSLAKVYLRFGLPSEAFDLLPDHNAIGQKYWLAKAVAEVMANRRDAAANQLAKYVSCSSDILFWTFMADPAGADLAQVDSQVLLRGFLRLPREVQSIMSSRFRNTLRLSGLADLAEEVRLASISIPIRRTLPEPESVAVVLNAQAATLADDKDATQNNDAPMFGAIEVVSTAWANDGNLEPGVVETIASYAFEQRSTAISPTLNLTLLRAYLLSNLFDEAFSLLRQSDFGDLRQDAEDSFAYQMEQRLTGFDLVKFRYLMRERGPSPERDEEAASMDLIAQALGSQLAAMPQSVRTPIRNEPTVGEPSVESGAIEDTPELARGVEILGNSATLREGIQNALFAD